MEKTKVLLKNILIWVLVLVGILIAARIVMKIAKGRKKPAELIYNVGVANITKQPIVRYLSVQGVVEGDPQVKVYPAVAGKFSKNAVAEGAMVKKDDTVVFLDRDMVGYKYELAPVKAPAAGMVTKLYYIDKGDAVNPEMPVAEIANEEKIKVVFNVGQEELIKLKKGQKVKISFIDDDSIFVEGQVFSVPPVINNDIMAGTIVVKAENKAKKMKLGMSVNVNIEINNAEGYKVLEKAVLMGENTTYIYIVEKGLAKQLSVSTGYRENDMIEISGAELKDGQEVITDGNFRIAEGAVVNTKIVAAPVEEKKWFDFFKKK